MCCTCAEKEDAQIVQVLLSYKHPTHMHNHPTTYVVYMYMYAVAIHFCEGLYVHTPIHVHLYLSLPPSLPLSLPLSLSLSLPLSLSDCECIQRSSWSSESIV